MIGPNTFESPLLIEDARLDPSPAGMDPSTGELRAVGT